MFYYKEKNGYAGSTPKQDKGRHKLSWKILIKFILFLFKKKDYITGIYDGL